jgi:hypothetical protein
MSASASSSDHRVLKTWPGLVFQTRLFYARMSAARHL